MGWLIFLNLASLLCSLVSAAPPILDHVPPDAGQNDIMEPVLPREQNTSIVVEMSSENKKGFSTETVVEKLTTEEHNSESQVPTQRTSRSEEPSEIASTEGETPTKRVNPESSIQTQKETVAETTSQQQTHSQTEAEITSQQQTHRQTEETTSQQQIHRQTEAETTLQQQTPRQTEAETTLQQQTSEQSLIQTSVEHQEVASETPTVSEVATESTTNIPTTPMSTKKPKPSKPKPPRSTTLKPLAAENLKPIRSTTLKPLVAESPVTPLATVRPTYVTAKPTKPTSTQRYPCRCADGTCSCCTGIVLENFNVPLRSRACANVSYEPDDFAFNFRLAYNNIVLYNRRMSAKNPRPACIPINRYFGIKMCAKLTNVYMSGRNMHACLDFEGFFDDETAFKYSFNCFRVGAQGVAIVRPEDGGGLPPPPDEEEQTDEDYDDSARNMSDSDSDSEKEVVSGRGWKGEVQVVPN